MFFTRKKHKNIDSCLLSRTKNTEIFLFQSAFFRDIALIIEGSKSFFVKLLQVYVAVFLVKRPSKEYKKMLESCRTL